MCFWIRGKSTRSENGLMGYSVSSAGWQQTWANPAAQSSVGFSENFIWYSYTLRHISRETKTKEKNKKSGIKIYTTADMFWQILSQFVFCVSSLCFFNSFMKHDCWNPLGHNSFPEEKDFWNASQGHSGDNFSAEDCEDFHARAATEGASSWNLLLIQILDDFQRVPSN